RVIAPAELDEGPVDVDGAGLREGAHLAFNPGRIAAAGLEQGALEIGSDLDVHRRAERGLDLAAGVRPIRQYTDHYVVGVGGDDEFPGRKPHARRRLAGKDIAEIAGRHDEGDGAAELGGRREVVDALGRYAREVDRVDRGQADGASKIRFRE